MQGRVNVSGRGNSFTPPSPPGSRVTLQENDILSTPTSPSCHAEDTGGAQVPKAGNMHKAPWPDPGTPAPVGKGPLAPEAVATALFRAPGGEEAGPRSAAGRADGCSEGERLSLLCLHPSILGVQELWQARVAHRPFRRMSHPSLQEACDCSGPLYPPRHIDVQGSQSPLSASETTRSQLPSSP